MGYGITARFTAAVSEEPDLKIEEMFKKETCWIHPPNPYNMQDEFL